MAAPAEIAFNCVTREIQLTTRATVDIQGDDAVIIEGADAEAVVLQRNAVDALITYNAVEGRVIVVTSPGHGLVRSRCLNLPPERSTGFATQNAGVLAAIVNEAMDVLVFSGPYPPPPIILEGVFRRSWAETNHHTVKIIISDTRIFIPPLGARMISSIDLSLRTSHRSAPGVLFGFLRQDPNLEQGFLGNMILSASDGNRFTVSRFLARKLLQVLNMNPDRVHLRVHRIPESLLWILRFNFERDLGYRAEMIRDLMFRSSVFILRVLKWLPYCWIEEVAEWGCKILGNRINFIVEVNPDLELVEASLGMQ